MHAIRLFNIVHYKTECYFVPQKNPVTDAIEAGLHAGLALDTLCSKNVSI